MISSFAKVTGPKSRLIFLLSYQVSDLLLYDPKHIGTHQKNKYLASDRYAVAFIKYERRKTI